MKITASKIDHYIHSMPDGIKAVLLFGPDGGLADERAAAITNTIAGGSPDPFAISYIAPSALAADPALLLDEMLMLPLGGRQRVLIIRNGGEEVTKATAAAMKEISAEMSGLGFVIITAGNLLPRSSLRKLFESSDLCAALPCYPDDEGSLTRLVEGILEESGITADRTALQTITAALGTDRRANRQEIEKLALFAGEHGTLSEDDVQTCLGDNSHTSADETILLAAEGNYNGLDKQLEKSWAEGTSPVAVLRAAQRHFQKLHLVSSGAIQGIPIETAIKQLRPPLFWKNQARFRAQANNWPIKSIEQALGRLTEAELSVKSTGLPAEILCARALLAIAQLARSGKSRKHV